MVNAVDRAPIGPARCVLTLVMAEREAARARDSYLRLRCAAGLLEAALRWQFESLYTAALATCDPAPRARARGVTAWAT